MTFDWSINLGNVVSLLGFVFTIAVFFHKIASNHLVHLEQRLNQRIDELRSEVKDILHVFLDHITKT